MWRKTEASNGDFCLLVWLLRVTLFTISPILGFLWIICRSFCWRWTVPVSQKVGTQEPSTCSDGWSSTTPSKWTEKNPKISSPNKSELSTIMTSMFTGNTPRTSRSMIKATKVPSTESCFKTLAPSLLTPPSLISWQHARPLWREWLHRVWLLPLRGISRTWSRWRASIGIIRITPMQTLCSRQKMLEEKAWLTFLHSQRIRRWTISWTFWTIQSPMKRITSSRSIVSLLLCICRMHLRSRLLTSTLRTWQVD